MAPHLQTASHDVLEFAISKQERRLIGGLDDIRVFRDALEHADQRIRRSEVENTLLVPRELGVTFDDARLSDETIVGVAANLLAIARDILEAGAGALANDEPE